MDRKLINYLPYVVRDYAEFQGITGAEQPEFENAWAAVDDLLNNQFIKTAGNLGLSRWEKILGITPKGTDMQIAMNKIIRCNMIITKLVTAK